MTAHLVLICCSVGAAGQKLLLLHQRQLPVLQQLLLVVAAVLLLLFAVLAARPVGAAGPPLAGSLQEPTMTYWTISELTKSAQWFSALPTNIGQQNCGVRLQVRWAHCP